MHMSLCTVISINHLALYIGDEPEVKACKHRGLSVFLFSQITFSEPKAAAKAQTEMVDPSSRTSSSNL